MSLLGIDIGTTGCKVLTVATDGTVSNVAYSEYDITRSPDGRAELESQTVWSKIQDCIRSALHASREQSLPVAVSITSMGEAMVPVTMDRQILGPSLLNIDTRGNEYLPRLRATLSDRDLYVRNGNTWGTQYGATKLMWLKEHDPQLYERTDWFLHWAHFVAFMLGAEAVTDLSLANRSLLFDIRTGSWSDELIGICGLDRDKLPPPVQAGTVVGTISKDASTRLGLPQGIPIVAGAHDQCVNAVGCGAVREGSALYGMGTFPTIAPVFAVAADPAKMIEIGLCTEHHAIPGLLTGFLFHMGGASLKWYRDTFAIAEHRAALRNGPDIYPDLFAEIGTDPSGLLLLPYLSPMGPPDFIDDLSGTLFGLTVQTTRAQILQSIVESNAMMLNISVERLPEVRISVDTMSVVGGGSRSDVAVQINCDILGIPLVRPDVQEAGALGAALIAGVGNGTFASIEEALERTVRIERVFEPDTGRSRKYRELFDFFKEARRGTASFLRRFTAARDAIITQ